MWDLINNINDFIASLMSYSQREEILGDGVSLAKIKLLLIKLDNKQVDLLINYLLKPGKFFEAQLIMKHILLIHPPSIQQCNKILKYISNCTFVSSSLLGLTNSKLPISIYNKIIKSYPLNKGFVNRTIILQLSRNQFLTKKNSESIIYQAMKNKKLLSNSEIISNCLLRHYTDYQMIKYIRCKTIQINEKTGLILASKNWKTETLWLLEGIFKEYPAVVVKISQQSHYKNTARMLLKYL